MLKKKGKKVEADGNKQQKRLGSKLSGILREVARHLSPVMKRKLEDLSCSMSASSLTDDSVLSVKSNGFIVKQSTTIDHSDMRLPVLCVLQIVSMAVLYYRMYSVTHDKQDSRSCNRYCKWLQDYLKNMNQYVVCGNIRMGYFLTDNTQPGNDIDKLPKWLNSNDGETI
jgi:hypothetical protein